MKMRGQVWIETVIYTLIAFAMIGAVLSVAKPKIEEIQDKAIIDQTIGMLDDMNSIILSVKKVSGNQRIIELSIKKGGLNVDGVNDKIIFEMESRHTYSQPGEDVIVGSIIAHTEKKGKFSIVTLTSNYSEYNITYNEKDEIKTITKAATPYKLSILNKGIDKIEEGIWTENNPCNCPDKPGYSKTCTGEITNGTNVCSYKSDRIRIDIEVI